MPRYALGLILALFAAVGCGSTLPPETEPAKGRETLKTVLDSWVQGSAPGDLKPIVVADPDWEQGHKLTKYEVDPADDRAGVDLVLRVKLSLAKKDGQSQEKSVKFVVGMGTQTVVLRYY